MSLLVVVTACAGAAHAGTIASGNPALGGSTIRAYTAGATSYTTATNPYSNSYSMTMFQTFVAADFANAKSAPLASTLGTPLPGSWNNSANVAGLFTGTHSGVMNAAGARWIHDSINSDNGGHSVLFAVPFLAGNVSSVSMTITWLTDNGFGNTHGANGMPTPSGFANDGMFVNGTSLGYADPGGPAGSGQPASFSTIQSKTFNVAVNANAVNWLYLYQFNWGGPGGSAFTVSGADMSAIPQPMAVFSGSVGLLALGARRRRA
jgi:hypothetical protein